MTFFQCNTAELLSLWSMTASMFSIPLSNYAPNCMYFCSWIILQDFKILLFICYPGFTLFDLFCKIIFNFKVVLYHGCFSYNTEIHKYGILSPQLLIKILNNIKPIMKLWHCSEHFSSFDNEALTTYVSFSSNFYIYRDPISPTFLWEWSAKQCQCLK